MASKPKIYGNVLLENQSSNIRLLRVHPANTLEEPLICGLQVDYLDHQPTYAALSYTWGQGDFTHPLTCNNMSLKVTENLDRALRMYRLHYGGQNIWIDQICIDQENLPEKSSQIYLMNRIYKQASSVFVYLGGFDAGARMGVKLAFDVKRHHLQILACAVQGEDLTSYIPSDDDKKWDAWLDLFYRPWWGRVWVLQEAIGNQSVSVLCEDIFDWDALPFSFRFLTALANQYPASFFPKSFRFRRGMPLVMNRMHAWQSIMDDHKNSNSSAPLGVTLDRIRAFDSTNPRDKIYAVLDLVNQMPRMPTPDYDVPVEHVYQAFAEYLCSSGELYLVLSTAGMEKVLPKLPTWVPDWTCDAKGLSFQHVRGFGYCAGGDSRPVIELSENTPSIFVNGAFVDFIVDIGPARESSDIQPSDAIEFLDDYIPWTLSSWELINGSDIFKSLTPRVRLEMFSSLVSAGSPHVENPLDAYATTFNRYTSKAPPMPDIPNPFERYRRSDEDRLLSKDEYKSFTHVSSLATKARKICITSKGYVGLVPRLTEVGDKVCIFPGAQAPFILRKVGDVHNVVGDAFILNLMKGEALGTNGFVSSMIHLQ